MPWFQANVFKWGPSVWFAIQKPDHLVSGHILTIRKLDLSGIQMVTVVWYSCFNFKCFNPQLTAWQEDIQSASGLTATKSSLAIRGLTCNSLMNVDVATIPEIAAAYNSHVMDQHPERLKTLPMTLCKCFVAALKRYLTSKVRSGRSREPKQKAEMSSNHLADIVKVRLVTVNI